MMRPPHKLAASPGKQLPLSGAPTENAGNPALPAGQKAAQICLLLMSCRWCLVGTGPQVESRTSSSRRLAFSLCVSAQVALPGSPVLCTRPLSSALPCSAAAALVDLRGSERLHTGDSTRTAERASHLGRACCRPRYGTPCPLAPASSQCQCLLHSKFDA